MENEIKFEKALGELERIVGELEAGELSLDEALKRYEEGVKLSRACTKKLIEAEKKIEVLTRSLSDLSAAEIGSEGEVSSKKSEKKKTKKASKESSSNSEENDFLL